MKGVRIVIVAAGAVLLTIAASIVFTRDEGAPQPQPVRVAASNAVVASPKSDNIPAPPNAIASSALPRNSSNSKGSLLKETIPNSHDNAKRQLEVRSPAKIGPTPDEVKQLVAKAYEKMLVTDAKHVLQTPFAAAHSLAERETVDPAWAPGANQLIADAYADFGSRVDVSMINCRTDICEVRINSLPGGDWSADLQDVQYRLEAIKQQPWFLATFDDASFAASMSDEMPIMVIFLTRK